MQQSHNSPVRVLVIEDNPADVELLRMALDTAGFPYEMTVISDGADALALLRQMNDDICTLPDIVVLDLNLPKYDGLEILEAARSYPGLSELPIAILSSSSSPRELSKIQMFDFVRYLTKPADLNQYLGIGLFLRDFVLESRTRTSKQA